MTQKQQLDDTDDKYLDMKRELESKSTQLEQLSFINKDFKEKANIGMLEFLELELKNKENQLASLHARLDEKQKEYVSKIESYQSMFNEHRTRVKELEEENHSLRNRSDAAGEEGASSKGGRSEDVEKLIKQIETLEADLKQEKDKGRKLHEDVFKEKDKSMHLEIKLSDIERKNVDLQLRVSDLDSKTEEQQCKIAKLEVRYDNPGI